MMAFTLSDVLSRLSGLSTPIGGISWNAQPSQKQAANSLIVFLYDKRVLFEPAHAEIADHAVVSVLKIREELSAVAKKLPAGSELELKIRAMRSACVHFLNRVQRRPETLRFAGDHGHWASWEFLDALGQWRAFMAIYIGMICSRFAIEPPAFLALILPDTQEKIANADFDRFSKREASAVGVGE